MGEIDRQIRSVGGVRNVVRRQGRDGSVSHEAGADILSQAAVGESLLGYTESVGAARAIRTGGRSGSARCPVVAGLRSWVRMRVCPRYPPALDPRPAARSRVLARGRICCAVRRLAHASNRARAHGRFRVPECAHSRARVCALLEGGRLSHETRFLRTALSLVPIPNSWR